MAKPQDRRNLALSLIEICPKTGGTEPGREFPVHVTPHPGRHQHWPLLAVLDSASTWP